MALFLHTHVDPTVLKVHLSPPLSHCVLLYANTQEGKVPSRNPACLRTESTVLEPQTSMPTILTVHVLTQRQGIVPCLWIPSILVRWSCHICSSKACITQEPAVEKYPHSWSQGEAKTSGSNLKFSNNLLYAEILVYRHTASLFFPIIIVLISADVLDL